MKSKFLLAALAALIVSVWISYPIAARYQENARRRATMDVPQTERDLRVPTQQQLAVDFPNGSLRVLQESPQITLFQLSHKKILSNQSMYFVAMKFWGKFRYLA